MKTQRVYTIVIALAVSTFLALYLFAFIVGFDEMVLVTTFGKADPDSIKNVDGNQAGLYLRWPWPVQNVVRFDRRLLVLEDRLEQQETKDRQVVVMKAYLAWRISDPLQFYRSIQSYDKAEVFLRERLRTAKAELSRFTFDELTNPDKSNLKLDEAQDAILRRLKSGIGKNGFGISIESAGITRLLLPEQITSSVFARMRHTRQRMAQSARSEGDAVARSIRAKTESDRGRILAYTNRIAQSIRAEGDAEAAEYYKEYAKDEEFAVFLRKIDALKRSLSNNTTFIFDTKSEPYDLLKDGGK